LTKRKILNQLRDSALENIALGPIADKSLPKNTDFSIPKYQLKETEKEIFRFLTAIMLLTCVQWRTSHSKGIVLFWIRVEKTAKITKLFFRGLSSQRVALKIVFKEDKIKCLSILLLNQSNIATRPENES